MGKTSNIFPPMSGHQIDNLALELIKLVEPDALQTKDAFDVARFVDNELEDLGKIDIIYRNDLPDEIYGFTDTAENRVVINASIVEDPSQYEFLRSTLGHETGHVFLHVPLLRRLQRDRIFTQSKKDDSINLYRKDEVPIYRNPEWQAHRFSAGLLIPTPSLLYHLQRGEHIVKIAEIFNVTESFVRSRMRGLKLLK